ncbi:uncharacterized protein N7459_008932 [Penicillium hispanicum]|uniref:uncharacterized protein n=1 Tax=Penicillium hispanicum TaxID=1080232 RepID=UPI0025406690|nr:uncharacterized protein N7459_008932 [Penicillium hispanicum]KAJ5569502.1 hypothetical protein N7459_008932 [Penicillium hispanicum]
MLLKYLLLLATVWQSAQADSDACSNSVSISSQSDADGLSNCSTVDGSVTISSSATGIITLRNVEEIKGSFTAESASGLTQVVVPDLDTLQGALTVDSLDSLTNLSMSALSKVSSGVTITGNPKLKNLALEQLEEVNGQLKVTGAFTSVSLASLDHVNGQTTIRGSGSMSCTALNSLQSEGVYRGGYSCTGSNSTGSLSAGAKAGIAVGVIIGVLLLLLVLWFVLRQRRQRRRGVTRAEPTPALAPAATTDEKSSSPEYEPVPSHESPPPVPRKPVGPPPTMLDGRSVYEAANPATPLREYHELDAGPVLSSHQRPINSEA